MHPDLTYIITKLRHEERVGARRVPVSEPTRHGFLRRHRATPSDADRRGA